MVEAKRCEGMSYVEKYAEFNSQTHQKIGSWYTKVVCATEYTWGKQISNIAIKWGYPDLKCVMAYFMCLERLFMVSFIRT